MSGTLHCEEGDYKTSFSYFLESYEAFDSQEDLRALRSLKVCRLSTVIEKSKFADIEFSSQDPWKSDQRCGTENTWIIH